MSTEATATRPEGRRRLYITVPTSVSDALGRRSARNMRPGKLEAAHIILEALRASGDLPAEGSKR
jgi:hypothetical protein